MDYIRTYEMPTLRRPVMVCAFSGWSDAGQAATGALHYLALKLSATKFADLDPEEFYEFTTMRPSTVIVAPGQREVRWPTNEFLCWKSRLGPHDLVLFIGIEPNLKWRTYVNALLSVAGQFDTARVLSIGSLMDMVPHTREVRTTGSGTTLEMLQDMEGLGASISTYQGPTGITSALMEGCVRRGISYGSLWGHSPHYIQSIPNIRVSQTLVARLAQLIGFQVDMTDMAKGAAAFEEEVGKAIANSPEVVAYVQKLEEAYDAAVRPPDDLPRPEDVVKDLEDFLRRGQRGGESGPQPS